MKFEHIRRAHSDSGLPASAGLRSSKSNMVHGISKLDSELLADVLELESVVRRHLVAPRCGIARQLMLACNLASPSGIASRKASVVLFELAVLTCDSVEASSVFDLVKGSAQLLGPRVIVSVLITMLLQGNYQEISEILEGDYQRIAAGSELGEAHRARDLLAVSLSLTQFDLKGALSVCERMFERANLADEKSGSLLGRIAPQVVAVAVAEAAQASEDAGTFRVCLNLLERVDRRKAYEVERLLNERARELGENAEGDNRLGAGTSSWGSMPEVSLDETAYSPDRCFDSPERDMCFALSRSRRIRSQLASAERFTLVGAFDQALDTVLQCYQSLSPYDVPLNISKLSLTRAGLRAFRGVPFSAEFGSRSEEFTIWIIRLCGIFSREVFEAQLASCFTYLIGGDFDAANEHLGLAELTAASSSAVSEFDRSRCAELSTLSRMLDPRTEQSLDASKLSLLGFSKFSSQSEIPQDELWGTSSGLKIASPTPSAPGQSQHAKWVSDVSNIVALINNLSSAGADLECVQSRSILEELVAASLAVPVEFTASFHKLVDTASSILISAGMQGDAVRVLEAMASDKANICREDIRFACLGSVANKMELLGRFRFAASLWESLAQPPKSRSVSAKLQREAALVAAARLWALEYQFAKVVNLLTPALRRGAFSNSVKLTAVALQLRATAYENEGDFEASLKDLDMLLEIDSTDSPQHAERQFDARVRRARVLEQLMRFEEAALSYDHALLLGVNESFADPKGANFLRLRRAFCLRKGSVGAEAGGTFELSDPTLDSPA